MCEGLVELVGRVDGVGLDLVVRPTDDSEVVGHGCLVHPAGHETAVGARGETEGLSHPLLNVHPLVGRDQRAHLVTCHRGEHARHCGGIDLEAGSEDSLERRHVVLQNGSAVVVEGGVGIAVDLLCAQGAEPQVGVCECVEVLDRQVQTHGR